MLRHWLREKGITRTDEGEALFDALPDMILDFVTTPDGIDIP